MLNKMNATSTDMLRRKRFTKLQQLAVAASQGDEDNILFSWSPRLSSPTEEQLERVQTDITDMKDRLENNANRVAKELQLNADSVVAAKTAATRDNLQKKKKKRPPQAAKSAVEEETDACEVDSESNATLQDLIQQRLGEVNENVDSINHEEEWVPVVKKNGKGKAMGNKDTAKSSTDAAIGTAKQYSTNELDEDIFSDAADDPSTCDVVGSLTLPIAPLEESAKEPPVDQAESVSAISIHTANDDENVTHSATETSGASVACTSTTDSQSQDPQQRRINELEQRLSALQQQHAKTLRNQREHYDDLIQSLQLRLYISETRLKTYEQALEDHVQAVQANMAPSSPHRSRSMSGAIDTEDVVQVPASSPTLIAKAMEKNSGRFVQTPDGKGDAASTQHRRLGKASSKSTTMATSLFAMILCFSIALISLPVPDRT
ncbi:MAG: hypothetical protein SGILL_005010 [Bacillariaceae sp.]